MTENDEKIHRRILWTLITASSIVWIPNFLGGILLIDIAYTFNHPIGLIAQIFTFANIVGVISALMLGMLSIRYKMKTLLMVGIIAFVASSISCFLAPNLTAVMVSFSISGLGLAFVMPMSISLVGEHLPEEKRASAIGWISAFTSVPGLVFGPIIGYVVAYGGWRFAFIVFILPISLLALLVVLKWLPPGAISRESEMGNVSLLSGFREIVKNRSAVASLLGYILIGASMTFLGSFSPSYLREVFLVSTDFVSTVFASMYLVYSIGSIVCARVVGRFGRKRVLVVSLFVESVLIIISSYVPNLWLTLVVIYIAYIMMGFVFTVAIGLALEQVPEFRGTMMSLNSASGNLGMAFGAAFGGMILLRYDYGFVGVSLGALGIIATLIYITNVKDPS